MVVLHVLLDFRPSWSSQCTTDIAQCYYQALQGYHMTTHKTFRVSDQLGIQTIRQQQALEHIHITLRLLHTHC